MKDVAQAVAYTYFFWTLSSKQSSYKENVYRVYNYYVFVNDLFIPFDLVENEIAEYVYIITKQFKERKGYTVKNNYL